ncbi:PIR protein [Plasmodium vivax]|uniref:VIR protein n=1 Tax=Plasmodium vivax TaxID=5855 RepID=A0A565A5W6_PLAVI|nr:PIR protein [Plasmodium vivax]
MAFFSPLASRASQLYQRYQGVGCTSDYHKTKTEIEQKIATLDETNPRHFCKHCRKMKEMIINKDAEFKKCPVDKSNKLKLIDVNDDIQRFIDECITFNECVLKRSARNKQVTLKSTNTDLCGKNRRCNNGQAPKDGVVSKEQPRLATEASKSGGSLWQKSQSTRVEQAEGKDLKQKMLVSKTPMIANTLSNFVKTQHGESESVNNNQSITSAQVETSTQPLTASGQKITTEVDNHAISPTPLSSSGHESDSGIPVPGSHTNKGPVPKNSPDDQSYRNTPGEQDTAENIALGKDLAREVVVTKAPGSEVPAGEGFVQTYHRGPNADGLQSSSSDTSNVAATRVHVESAHSDTVKTYGDTSDNVNGEAVDHEHQGSKGSEVKDSVIERFAHPGTIHDNISNGRRDDTKISDDNGAGDELRRGEGSCTVPPCITGKGNELSNDQSNIFSKFVDAISNKDHIVQASPMGIVLLLSLLFKFTPLWRVLTKKNRKKGASINEELNSVLQEPSIMYDERSIPFSYGAFEYSSFDQNSY